MKSIVQRVLLAAGLLCVLSERAAAQADGSAPSSDSTYDGQWSLEFGISFQLLIQAVKSSFQVGKNGSFAWKEGEYGQAYTAYTGPGNSEETTHELLLRAQGQVLDKQTRTLKVTLGWRSGNGRQWDTANGDPIVWSVSASGDSVTGINAVGGSMTIPHPAVPSVWELKPTSIEQQDLGPDGMREVVTYRGRRQATSKGGIPVTEHIEVIQVRELKLVARG
jgi:hypothetical protein